MGRFTVLFVCALGALCLFPSFADAGGGRPSLKKAKMLRQHRLLDDAKREAIDVVFEVPVERAAALALLGEIAMEEGNYAAALDAWKRLEVDHPDSKAWKRVCEWIPRFQEATVDVGNDEVMPPVLRRMLRSAEFWSGRSKVFEIDLETIDPVQAAIYWYDRVVDECPGFDAGRVALEQKLLTILGWREGGLRGRAFGMKADFERWFPEYEKAFERLEHRYPKALSLQGFRFQAAQALLREGKRDDARVWLERVVELDYDRGGFYRHIAELVLSGYEEPTNR